MCTGFSQSPKGKVDWTDLEGSGFRPSQLETGPDFVESHPRVVKGRV